MNVRQMMDIFGESITRTLKTIDYAHHEAHDGRAFFAVYSNTANNADAIEVRFRPSSAERFCHMTITIDAALAATAQLFVNTTKTHVAGNAITPLNRDFNSANSSILTLCHTPAGAQAGVGDLRQYIGSATANGRSTIGGDASSRSEFILVPFVDYLIVLTSRANANALSIILDWYEHANKASL